MMSYQRLHWLEPVTSLIDLHQQKKNIQKDKVTVDGFCVEHVDKKEVLKKKKSSTDTEKKKLLNEYI